MEIRLKVVKKEHHKIHTARYTSTSVCTSFVCQFKILFSNSLLLHFDRIQAGYQGSKNVPNGERTPSKECIYANQRRPSPENRTAFGTQFAFNYYIALLET